MTDQPKTEPIFLREWIYWIMGGLLAWGAFIAIGAYVYGGNYALLKAVIIMVCAVIFVEFWWLALSSRERRLNRLRAKEEK
jgi:hypothetical protein